MGFRGNNVLHKNHFRKDWQRRVKTWFDQPGAKKRRRNARQAKAAAAGLLDDFGLPPDQRQTRSFTKPCTFTIDPPPPPTRRPMPDCSLQPTHPFWPWFHSCRACICRYPPQGSSDDWHSYDHRRRNKSEEGVSINVERLTAYKERLIIFPKNAKKPAKADSTDLSAATTQDVSGPLPLPSGTKPEAARAITSEELEFSAFRALRQARATQRQAGVWKARKQKKDEEDAAKKK
ncbi:hypothetical protein PSHT_07342 [Puccinia striiformis]|uniref:60S ribosomal protein L13 n=1 Tax=Puccinia striiformis TaxID=27350 RepID=A0A2S4VYL1_9BASI|nr:hypothetical protein PSHT_07342 [Puccinia striiformis]